MNPSPLPQPRMPLRPAFSSSAMPTPRLARFAERLAFVDVKLEFIAAVAPLAGADWLRRQVRAAEQPSDLWLLRGAVHDALALQGRDAGFERLLAGLAALFPQGTPRTPF